MTGEAVLVQPLFLSLIFFYCYKNIRYRNMQILNLLQMISYKMLCNILIIRHKNIVNNYTGKC